MKFWHIWDQLGMWNKFGVAVVVAAALLGIGFLLFT